MREAEGYEPRWDITAEVGHQGQLWIKNLIDSFKGGFSEVKNDTRVLEFGSVYVEYKCLRGGKYRASGIATTESEAWAIVCVERELAIVIAVDTLKKLVKEAWKDPKNRKQLTRGTHPTRGVRIPISKLIDYMRKIPRAA